MNRSRGEFDWTAYLGWLAVLAVLIVVLAWLVVRIRTRFRDDDDTAAGDRSMLMQLGDLHRQGDLSEAEFRSIKRALAERFEGDAPREPGQDEPAVNRQSPQKGDSGHHEEASEKQAGPDPSV